MQNSPIKDTKFKVQLTIGNKTFKSENDDLYKAFDSLEKQVDNTLLKSKGVIVVNKGDFSRERFFYPLQLRMFLRNKLSRLPWLKVISSINN